jgi:hypothetical protein
MNVELNVHGCMLRSHKCELDHVLRVPQAKSDLFKSTSVIDSLVSALIQAM